MTVGELISNLNKYPKDFEVVIDISSDYEEYGVVEYLKPVKTSWGRCGGRFEKNSAPNSVLLT